jgi:hypothetical protein
VLQGHQGDPDNPVPVNLTSPTPEFFICSPAIVAKKGTGKNLDEFLFPVGKPSDLRKHPFRKNFWQPVLVKAAQ